VTLQPFQTTCFPKRSDEKNLQNMAEKYTVWQLLDLLLFGVKQSHDLQFNSSYKRMYLKKDTHSFSLDFPFPQAQKSLYRWRRER